MLNCLYRGSRILRRRSIYRSVNSLIFVLAVGAVLTLSISCYSVAEAKRPSDGKFTGVPRDIDFIKNSSWSQVILQGNSPTDALISETTNDRIQSILLVAFRLKSQVTVEYIKGNPNKLTSVTLPVMVNQEQGYVLNLSVDEKNNYKATVFDQGKKVNVWTKSAQMQRILETAVAQSIPVQEFAYDAATMEITRGKVNVELQK
jgi:hypothetical protein